MHKFLIVLLAVLFFYSEADAQVSDKDLKKSFITLLKKGGELQLKQYKGELKQESKNFNTYTLNASPEDPASLLADSVNVYHNKADDKWSIIFYYTNKTDDKVRAAKITIALLEEYIADKKCTLYDDYDDGKFYDEYKDETGKHRCTWYVSDYGRSALVTMTIYEAK